MVRNVLRVLAVAVALGFLAAAMVSACASARRDEYLSSSKAMTVPEANAPPPSPMYLPATKAAPMPRYEQQEAPPQRAPPQQQAPPPQVYFSGSKSFGAAPVDSSGFGGLGLRPNSANASVQTKPTRDAGASR